MLKFMTSTVKIFLFKVQVSIPGNYILANTSCLFLLQIREQDLLYIHLIFLIKSAFHLSKLHLAGHSVGLPSLPLLLGFSFPGILCFADM